VVEGAPEFFDRRVEVVGVLASQGQEQLFAALPVAPLGRVGVVAAEAAESGVGGVRVRDGEPGELVVHLVELMGHAEQVSVDLANRSGRGAHHPVVTGRGEQEPQHGQVEDQREDQQLVGVELAFALPVPGPFD